jgi:hypothetical protein
MNDTESKEELTFNLLNKWGNCTNITMTDKAIVEMYAEKFGFTKRPQDNNLMPLDVKKLSVLLCAHRGGHPGFPTTSWDNELAELICSKFGKDNSGMVPRKEYLMCSTHQVGIMPNRLCGYCELERLSQQPQKERKVSLEELVELIKYELKVYNNDKDDSYKIMTTTIEHISQAILSLLNATEERKGA